MTMELWGAAELNGVFSAAVDEVVEWSAAESPRLTDGVFEAASFPVSVDVLLGEILVERVDSSLLAGCARSATMLLNKRHRQSRAPALGYPVNLIADTTLGR